MRGASKPDDIVAQARVRATKFRSLGAVSSADFEDEIATRLESALRQIDHYKRFSEELLPFRVAIERQEHASYEHKRMGPQGLPNGSDDTRGGMGRGDAEDDCGMAGSGATSVPSVGDAFFSALLSVLVG